MEKSSSPSKISSEEITLYVTNCLEKVSEEVIIGVGQGGGHFYPNEFSLENGVSSYYGKEGAFNFPTKSEIEEEISNVVSEKLIECTGNFTNFTNYEIVSLDPETSTRILEGMVGVSSRYPLRIIFEDDFVLVEDFKIELEIDLNKIYLMVNKIIDEEPLQKGICLSCNFKHSLDNDLTIDYLNYDSTTTIFVIKDEGFEVNGEPYEFVFANDYSEENGI